MSASPAWLRRGRCSLRACSFLLLLAGATGCIPAVHNRVPDSAVVPDHLTALPPMVVVYTLDSAGERARQNDAADELGIQAQREVAAVMRAVGGRVTPPEQVAACGELCLRFFRWGSIASLEIAAQRLEIRDYGSTSVADWVFPGDINLVRAALGSDLALFVVLKQMRQTSAARALMILGGGYTVGKQIDVACVADLRDGKMSWCSLARDEKGDLAQREQIGAVIRRLLRPVIANRRPPSPAPPGPASPVASP